jgi:hypothetical protein
MRYAIMKSPTAAAVAKALSIFGSLAGDAERVAEALLSRSPNLSEVVAAAHEDPEGSMVYYSVVNGGVIDTPTSGTRIWTSPGGDVWFDFGAPSANRAEHILNSWTDTNFYWDVDGHPILPNEARINIINHRIRDQQEYLRSLDCCSREYYEKEVQYLLSLLRDRESLELEPPKVWQL